MAVTPDACQVAIDAAARRVGVSFSDRDDSVSADGAGAVAVLAAAMIGCPGARFAIALGDRAIDDPARLGRRAATLGAALVDEGVPAGAITATAASQGEGLSIRVEGAAVRERRVEPPVFNDILRAPEVDIPATPLPPAPILP
jgi:hypothetical protein